jgi:prepilin-type processing-associated H-X9-DG protein
MTYVYVAKGMTLTAGRGGDTVVAYEHLNHHNNEGMNFLYADGHVEFQARAVARHLVSEIAAGHNPPRAMDSARSGGR